MHDQVNTCTVDTPVVAVARMMIRLHVHRVIVVEGDRPLGVISSLDLVKLLVPAE
jgi:CBS domain-containing protein